MTTPEIRRFSEADALAEAVAEAFVARLSSRSELAEVSLTGGTIARTIHRSIAARAGEVSWADVRFWFGDERFVESDSSDRNAGQAREDLLDALIAEHGLPTDRVMEVPASDQVADVRAAATAYADLLRHEGTGGFDLVMLGMGPDGHVASLFPGHPAAQVTDEIAVPVTDSPKPPPERVSLTFEALTRQTDAVWLLVSGEEKAEAVARALAEEGSVVETPARGIAAHADPATEIVWWLDEAAASRL